MKKQGNNKIKSLEDFKAENNLSNLKRYNKFLEILLDTMEEYIYVVTKDYRIKFMNKKHIERLGHNAIGEICYRAIHDFDSVCPWCVNEQVFKGETVRFNFQSLKSDKTNSDERKWFSVINKPIYDLKGNALKLSVATDITEIKKKEIALKKSEELFYQVFNQSENAIIILDPNNCEFIDMNDACRELFGFSNEEYLRHGPSIIFDNGGFIKCKLLLCSSSLKKSCLTLDKIKCKTKKGKRIYVNIKGRAITLNNRMVAYCSFNNITDKILKEEKLKQLQAKMIQTDKMSFIGLLSSGVLHDINNPNNFIMFNSQLLVDIWKDFIDYIDNLGPDNEKVLPDESLLSDLKLTVPKLLLGIKEGSKQITKIAESIKALARQNCPTLDCKVDINQIINHSLFILDYKIKKSDAELKLKLGNELPKAKGDPQLIEQVIINLILNAIQSLDHKGAGVTISTCLSGESNQIVVEIRDEGVGMSEEVLAQAVDPFYTTKLDKGGTGLGLFISDMIVKEHKGKFEIESELDKGTCVTVMLPAFQTEEEKDSADKTCKL